MHPFSEILVVHLKTTWSVLISSAVGATWTHAQPVEELEAHLNTLAGFRSFQTKPIRENEVTILERKNTGKDVSTLNSDRRAGKVDCKRKRMIWKGTSTFTTTAIKILALIACSCLIDFSLHGGRVSVNFCDSFYLGSFLTSHPSLI